MLDPAPPGGLLGRSAIAIAVFLVAFGVLVLARPEGGRGPARIDEAEWLSMGVVSWQLATTGSVPDRGASPTEAAEAATRPWRLGITESTFGWMNPVLPKLAFGAVSDAAGVRHTSRAIYPRFRGPRAGKAAKNRAVEVLEPALEPNRKLVAGLGALCILGAFLVARATAGVAGGLAATLLLLLSPTFRDASTYVRTDLFPLAFGLLALAFVQRWSPELFGRKPALRSALACAFLGLLAGLAVGCKLNGALTSFAIAGWFGILPALGERTSPRVLIARLAGIGLVCASILWLCLPALWSELPWKALPDLLHQWRVSFDFQVQKSGGPAPTEALERAGLALRRAFFDQDPLAEFTGLPLGIALVPAGLVALVARFRSAPRPYAALLVHVLVLVAGTALWLPLDRERFFLPLLVPLVLLQVQVAGLLPQRLNPR